MKTESYTATDAANSWERQLEIPTNGPLCRLKVSKDFVSKNHICPTEIVRVICDICFAY